MKYKNTPILTRLGGDLRRPGPLQRTTRITLALLLVLSHPLWAATIIVDETSCTLVDAITAANTDTAVGGCAAGSGADTIELTTDVTLTEVNNDVNGLPKVESDITVEGGGFTIERDPGAPPFRFFDVSAGTLALNNVTVRRGGDGAIYVRWWGPELILTNSTVTDNLGDGILSNGGLVTVTNSTVSNNSETGIVVTFLPFVLTNSTVSGNGSHGIQVFAYATVESTIQNTTISGNLGSALFAACSYGGGADSVFHVANSIIANNAQCTDSAGSCVLQLIDEGNNFADDGACGSGFADITPDVDFDTTLADNGGPTQTHALFPGSVAIDAAGDCGLETDQRGYPRDDGACDSGSFEFQEPSDVPASSPVSLLVLLAVMMGVSWRVLVRRRRAWTTRPPT